MFTGDFRPESSLSRCKILRLPSLAFRSLFITRLWTYSPCPPLLDALPDPTQGLQPAAQALLLSLALIIPGILLALHILGSLLLLLILTSLLTILVLTNLFPVVQAILVNILSFPIPILTSLCPTVQATFDKDRVMLAPKATRLSKLQGSDQGVT